MKKVLANIGVFSLAVLPQMAMAQVGTNLPTGTNLSTRGLADVATSIINAVLGFLFIIVLAVILWGGFRWMTAGGNEESVGEAKKIIAAGIIGLIVVLVAYAIVNFVVSTVG